MEKLTVLVSLVLACFAAKTLGQIYSLGDEPWYSPNAKSGQKSCETKRVHCRRSDKFPTFDGSCNNLKNPTWGVTGTPHPRMLSAEYDDSAGSPRMYGAAGRLPSTRAVSNTLKDIQKKFSSSVSHMHVLFGQLLAHDIVHTPIVKKSDGTKIDCNCAGPHRDCINIEIPRNDEQFIQANKACMGLARSKPAVGLNCRFSQREQLNSLSSVLDGTFVYGKTDKEARELRDPFSNAGELKTRENPVGGPHKLMPTQDEMRNTGIGRSMDCPMKVHKTVGSVGCFVAGDVRNNENTGLVSIQTIWLRYHNKVARELKSVNPTWSSDTTFNVARRILSAMMQIITYREYLPPLLGSVWMDRFDLNLQDEGYWNGYDEDYNPSITNAFTTAAFRYGHSQVAEKLTRPTPSFTRGSTPDLTSAESFFNSKPLLSPTGGGVGSLMRGFMTDKAESTDPTLADALRNQLLTEFGKKFGNDLFAVNTQRGRDHGLPGYNKYRELCGLSRARTFAQLSGEIPHSRISRLQRIYNSVDDIDLYPGGLSEDKVPGGEVGPTFACILAYGFRAIRKGDRYWHEHEFSPSPFTDHQLSELRKMTFARMVCDTGEDMKYVIRRPMDARSQAARCGAIDDVDFSAWADRPMYYGPEAHGGNEVVSTPWFVTDETGSWVYNSQAIARRLRQTRGDDICDDVVDYESRSVPGDSYLQIRFTCKPGTIKGTDFPHQLSDKYYWSEWVTARSSGYGRNSGSSVGPSEFSCRNIVAIQAMTQSGRRFARETGDVFEDYSVTGGFTCRDQHQLRGSCENYKVRVLCGGKKNDYVPPPTIPYIPPTSLPPYGPFSTPLYIPPTSSPYYGPFSTPFRPIPFTYPTRPPSTTPNIPDNLANVALNYCFQYGVCCADGSDVYVSSAIPYSVVSFAEGMCAVYGICCE